MIGKIERGGKNMATNNRLGHEKISKLLFALAIPSIIAQLVNILYNIVDRIYIGQMTDGTSAMAALSVALPILTFITAFTQLVGIGGAPLCAIKLGEQRKDKAEEIMTNSFVLLIVAGILLTIVVLIWQEPLLLLFGANEETLSQAISYISIYALGTIFVQITLGMNAYINTQGFAKTGMCTVVIGAIFNIVLDPIFIFWLDMGVAGAALATIISQGVSAVWVLIFLFGKKSTIKIRKQYLKPNWHICLSIMALGISPFVQTATESLLQISFNNQLLIYGGTMAVATMAILMSLWQFITLPLQGLCQGAQPIMSYNYGAKLKERMHQILKVSGLVIAAILGAGTLLFFIVPNVLLSLFNASSGMLKIGETGLRILSLSFIVSSFGVLMSGVFEALGLGKYSLIVSLLRQLLITVPLAYILLNIMGIEGIWMSFVIAEAIASIVAYILYRKKFKTI